MNPPRHRILVVGCGSIGERHLRAILATGRADAIACDNRGPIREKMTKLYGVESVADWRTARSDQRVTGALVATPAPLHVDLALTFLEIGWHVLIEKPLAVTLDGIERLPAARDGARKFAAVGYVNHNVPAMSAGRDFVRSGAYGQVRHVTVTAGQNFPTFRPAYREIYYRDHAQGGGAIQDALTHLANAVEWMVGPTTRLYCDAAHQVLEGVEVEDTVNVVAHNGDILVSYALNQFQAPNEMRIELHAERGSVRIESSAERWGTMAAGETSWNWKPAPVVSRDAVFAAQMNAFFDGCEGKPHPLCTLEEGIQTLRFNLAALQSWRQGKPVEIASASAPSA